jgi:hypothetical protein
MMCVAILALAGCIALVNDDASGLGTTCHIMNEGTPCGQCVLKACQGKLDACCADASCHPTLDTLDACTASFAGAACAALTKSGGTASAKDALAACLGPCASICAASTAPSVTYCSNIIGSECDCYTDSSFSPNDARCDATTVDNGVCCADPQWPGMGLQCSCKSYKCKETTDGGCICGTETSGPMNSCSMGQYCCVTPGLYCTCGATPCDSTSTQVAACTAANWACESQVSVRACSATAASLAGSDAGAPDTGGGG